MVQEMNIQKRGENWSKVYGPYLILFEYKAGSPQASWRDAKSSS
jgi:rhamnogalacturonan endolyase